MNNLKKKELGLIRSRFLASLFSLLFAFVVLSPSNIFATNKGKENNGNIYMHPLNKDYHAAVTLANFDEGKYTLTVESENGEYVYYDEILEFPKKFAKVFDFSRLENGEYTLFVKSKNMSNERHFTIKNGEIKINNESKNQSTPIFKTQGKKAMLLLPNNKKSWCSIKVISPDGTELFETLERKENIKKIFDFSNVSYGNYIVKVSSNDTKYAYQFINN